jgi:hypothetical protein
MLTYLLLIRPLRRGLKLARRFAPSGTGTVAVAAVLASVATTVSMSGSSSAEHVRIPVEHKRTRR